MKYKDFRLSAACSPARAVPPNAALRGQAAATHAAPPKLATQLHALHSGSAIPSPRGSLRDASTLHPTSRGLNLPLGESGIPLGPLLSQTVHSMASHPPAGPASPPLCSHQRPTPSIWLSDLIAAPRLLPVPPRTQTSAAQQCIPFPLPHAAIQKANFCTDTRTDLF